MKKILFILLCLFVFTGHSFAVCPSPEGTVYTAVDATAAEVQSCIDAAEAASGGTVNIPAGVVTYSGGSGNWVSKTITKDLIISGAGTSAETGTYITNGISTTQPVIEIVANGTTKLTIKDIRLKAYAGANTNGTLWLSGTSNSVLIKNIYFDMTGINGGRMVQWGTPTTATQMYGVMTGCTFYNPAGSGQGISFDGNSEGSYYYWSGNPTFGTANAKVVEGCTFNYTNGAGDGAFDAYSGSRIIFRYNTVIGTSIGWHGNDSSSGLHSAEIYNNAFTSLSPSGSAYALQNLRGGTALIYNNTADTSYASGILLALYRACQAQGRDGKICQGAGDYDGNTTGGYACYQQPGTTGNNGITNWPIVAWNNKRSGVNMIFSLNANHINPTCDQTYDIEDYIVDGRDTVNDETCEGVTSDFCTAWWDDTNNKGKLNGDAYTPYTCPHGLTGLSGSCTDTVGVDGYNKESSFTMTPSSGTGYVFSPSSAQTVSSGSTQAFSLTCSYGYKCSVSGCGGTPATQSGAGTISYTTAAASENCSVTGVAAKTQMEGIGTGSGSLTGIGSGTGTMTLGN